MAKLVLLFVALCAAAAAAGTLDDLAKRVKGMNFQHDALTKDKGNKMAACETKADGTGKPKIAADATARCYMKTYRNAESSGTKAGMQALTACALSDSNVKNNVVYQTLVSFVTCVIDAYKA